MSRFLHHARDHVPDPGLPRWRTIHLIHLFHLLFADTEQLATYTNCTWWQSWLFALTFFCVSKVLKCRRLRPRLLLPADSTVVSRSRSVDCCGVPTLVLGTFVRKTRDDVSVLENALHSISTTTSALRTLRRMKAVDGFCWCTRKFQKPGSPHLLSLDVTLRVLITLCERLSSLTGCCDSCATKEFSGYVAVVGLKLLFTTTSSSSISQMLSNTKQDLYRHSSHEAQRGVKVGRLPGRMDS